MELGREIVIPIKNPNGLAFDGKYLWVADYNQKKPGEIIAIDPVTHGIIRSAVVLPHMEGLAWDGSHLWIASHFHGREGFPVALFDADGFVASGKVFDVVGFDGVACVALIPPIFQDGRNEIGQIDVIADAQVCGRLKRTVRVGNFRKWNKFLAFLK